MKNQDNHSASINSVFNQLASQIQHHTGLFYLWQMYRGDFNPGSDEPQHCRLWACLHDNNALKMKRVFFAFLEGLAYRRQHFLNKPIHGSVKMTKNAVLFIPGQLTMLLCKEMLCACTL